MAEVTAERRRQEKRKREGRFEFTCADPEMGDYERLTVLVEEVGEVARDVLSLGGLARDDGRGAIRSELREELAQVAAVAVAWMESIQ